MMMMLLLLLPYVVTVVVSLPKRKESSYLYGRMLSELLCARKSACGTQSELPCERTEKVISKVVSYGEWKPYRLLISFRSLVYAQLLCFVGNVFEFCLIVVGHQTKRHDHFFAVF